MKYLVLLLLMGCGRKDMYEVAKDFCECHKGVLDVRIEYRNIYNGGPIFDKILCRDSTTVSGRRRFVEITTDIECKEVE